MKNKPTFLAGQMAGEEIIASYNTVDVAPVASDIGLFYFEVPSTRVATKIATGNRPLGVLHGNSTGKTFGFIQEGHVPVQCGSNVIALGSYVAIANNQAITATTGMPVIGIAKSANMVDMNGVNVVLVEMSPVVQFPGSVASMTTSSTSTFSKKGNTEKESI